MISASLSPNTQIDDVLLAIKILFSPWKWQQGDALLKVSHWFDDEMTLFSSGRVALFALLNSFGIGAGDEVIIQAFTCVAVPNSIVWAGAKPVYADIGDSYNIDPKSFEKNITKKTKAVVLQHTFGIAADIPEISRIAKKYGILLIEDFAHSLGMPMCGDAAFFSFGRDKVISSVWGGGAIINAKWQMANGKLKKYEKELPDASNFWIFQQLLHPVAFSLILMLYDVIIGKILLVLLQKLRLLSIPVYPEEKRAGRPSELFVKFPNALAILALHQLKKLDGYNRVRKQISAFYAQKSVEGIYLRYPMLVKEPQKIIDRAKKHGVLLGNWYHNVIDPTGVDFELVEYKPGSCPKAEDVARHIINLPTLISIEEAQHVKAQVNN